MIIDFHVHLFKDELAPIAVEKLKAAAGVPHFSDGTKQGLLDSMHRAGVDLSVCQHIATKPEQTQKINQWAIEIQSDKILSFGTIHPNYLEWEQEIDFLSEYGIKGIKFHPDYQNFCVDEMRMYPLYEKIFSKGMILLFHAGVDLAYAPPHSCMPEALSQVVEDFPQGKIVAAHMGGYRYWDDVEEYLVGKNLYFDTSYSFDEMGKNRMERVISKHGVERILFASDSPWTPQDKEIEKMHSMNLPEHSIESILGGNAKHLLNI